MLFLPNKDLIDGLFGLVFFFNSADKVNIAKLLKNIAVMNVLKITVRERDINIPIPGITLSPTISKFLYV